MGARLVRLFLAGCFAVCSASSVKCQQAAQIEMQRAPDRSEMEVTTSHLFKKQLAKFFCPIARNWTVLELGIFHGHTTAVLAAIFQKVISVDINADFLQVAAEYNKHHSNVLFLSVDSLSDAWGSFKNNPIDVIVIDGDHTYKAVHADTLNSLRHLKPLKYLVFDDFFSNEGVRRTIQEFAAAGGLSDCQAIGHGSDGSRWMYHDYIEGLYSSIISELPEGFLCKPGELWNPVSMLNQEFLSRSYLVYALPIAFPVPSGLWQFSADGGVSVTSLGQGTWKIAEPGKMELVVHISGLAERKLRFNLDRTAFVMAEAGVTRWYGIQEHLMHRPFHILDSVDQHW